MAVVMAGALVALVAEPLLVPTSASAETMITLSGGGYGHGVGMSQYGARGRADADQTAAQILDAYYPGAPIETRSFGTIRVKLCDTSSFTMTGADRSGGSLGGSMIGLGSASETLTVTPFATGVAASWGSGSSGLAGASTAAVINWNNAQRTTMSCFGRALRPGRLIVRSNGSSLEVILEMTLQEYLNGLGEVPSSWPTEALRTQAIAGRTYAAYRMANPRSATYDILATTADQGYVGDDKAIGAQGDRWVGAVSSTGGQVLTSGGAVIQAFYSSSNGGFSEVSDYVFVTPKSYLRAAADPFDQATGNPNFAWTRTYGGDELAGWLRDAGKGDVGSVTSVDFGGNIGASGRVDRATLTISGTTGAPIAMTGNAFRSLVNARTPFARNLLSTKFGTGVPRVFTGNPVGATFGAVPWGSEVALAVGWAADPDAPMSPISVHIYVDGVFTTAIDANRHSEDIGRAVPWFGPDHQWAVMVWAKNPTTTICAYAINAGPGDTNTALGCAVVKRSSPPATTVKRSRRSTRRRAAVRPASTRRVRRR